MDTKFQVIGSIVLERLESRLFMSAGAPAVDSPQTFTAGQTFAPITIDQATPTAKPA